MLHDTGLGELGNNAICQELLKSVGRKRKPQSTYSDEDRYLIAKYAEDHGASQAAKFFKNKFPTLNSIVQTFDKKYDQNVKVAKVSGQSPDKKLKHLMRGRPLMVASVIDEKVRKFMVSIYKKGGHVRCSIAATTAMISLSRTNSESVKNVVVTSTWGRSLLQKIWFRRRAATTVKVEMTESAKKETGLQYHYRIISIVEKHNISVSLVINSDQKPSKYVQVERFTRAPQGAKKVGRVEIAGKPMITLHYLFLWM